jgi:hypothetical protein
MDMTSTVSRLNPMRARILAHVMQNPDSTPLNVFSGLRRMYTEAMVERSLAEMSEAGLLSLKPVQRGGTSVAKYAATGKGIQELDMWTQEFLSVNVR